MNKEYWWIGEYYLTPNENTFVAYANKKTEEFMNSNWGNASGLLQRGEKRFYKLQDAPSWILNKVREYEYYLIEKDI